MSNEDADEGKVSWWKGKIEKIISWLKIKYSDIKEFIKRRFRWFISLFSIRRNIDYYNRYTIGEILDKNVNVEEELKKELQRVRFYYNTYDKFSSNFVFAFLSGFIGLLVGQAKNISVDRKVNILKILGIDFFSLSNKIGNVKPNEAILLFIGGFFLVILFFQWLFVCGTNTYYEKMEVVKAELKKIKKSKSKCEEMKVSEAELNEMKLIKDELEKINNTIQPNPEKISIRISNRSSVRRSIFGR